MESLKIENHIEQLKQLCNVCKKAQKCKDHNKVCALKKLAWNYAKLKYKKKGGTVANGSI